MNMKLRQNLASTDSKRRSRRVCVVMLSLSALIGIAGCNVGPNYERPEVRTPTSFTESFPGPATRPVALSAWWASFNDPRLNDLVERSLQSNLDLRIAAARVRETRAQRGVIDANLFPMVDAGGSFTRSKASDNIRGDFSIVPGASNRASNLWQAGFDAGWEIDIFGGTRRELEAAEADISSAIEDQRDVRVTLLAEVARNYIELRGAQRRTLIARKNIDTQRETLDLTRAKADAGLGSDLDVARAEALVATSESTIPSLESAERRAAHALAVLLGQGPGTLVQDLAEYTPLPVGTPALPVILPSELLRRRPDIRRAEADLRAITARVGVATADLFPRFSLTGGLGLESEKFKDLARGDSLYWSIGPSVSWPIFDAGRIRANIRVQNYRTEQALARYEKAVLTSLQEVEDALVNYDRERIRRDSLARAVAANQRAVELADALYGRGLATFLDVLSAQTSLFEAEDAYVQSDQLLASNLVAVYKALGGGWQLPDEASPL